MRKLVVITFILNIIAVTGLFLMYGPFSYFRDMLVLTANETMTHQYIAKIFYEPETIEQVLKNNRVVVIIDNTDLKEIGGDTGSLDKDRPMDEYEAAILDHEEGALYKVITIKEPNYTGYLIAVYDPSRIDLVMTQNLGRSGQFVTTMARNNGAQVAINASGFQNRAEVVTGGFPAGRIIKDGELIWNEKGAWAGGLIGFTFDNKLLLTYQSAEEAIEMGMRNAVEFGPFLIVNGKPLEIVGQGSMGVAPRTAIGQRKDGIVLLLVIDGRQPGYSLGADLKDLVDIFTRYRAHNAANLDGGASTSLVIDNKIVNRQNYDRAAPNAWIVK